MKRFSLFLLLFIFYTQFLAAQTEMPVWLVFEQAKKAYFENDLSESLRLFRKCIDRKSVFPEADFWIGKIFEKEGEYTLALKQYKKAATDKKQLYNQSEYYSILYHTAAVYKLRHLYQQYEETLLEICKSNPVFADNQNLEYQRSIINTFENRGVNNAFELYRFNIANAVDAHRQLGVFYYLTGRFYNSVLHLSYAAISASTVLINFFHDLDPEYVYSDFGEFLKLSEHYPESMRFFEESQLYQVYYYLAAVLHARGHTNIAREIWWQILKFDETGEWGIRSHLQYKDPYIEPLLDVKPPF